MSVVPHGHESKKSHRRDAVIYPESPVSLDEPAQLKTLNKNDNKSQLCNDVFLQYLKDEFKNNPHLINSFNISTIFPKHSSENYIEKNAKRESVISEGLSIYDDYLDYKRKISGKEKHYENLVSELKMAITNHITHLKTRYQGDISQIPFSKFIDDIPSLEEQCNFRVILQTYKKLATIIKSFDFNKDKIDPVDVSKNIREYFSLILDLNIAINNIERKKNRGGKTKTKKSQVKRNTRRRRT